MRGRVRTVSFRISNTRNPLRRQVPAPHVRLQLLLDHIESRSVSPFDRLCRIIATGDTLKKSLELIRSRAIAEHQVMHEGPRLSIKDPGLIKFIVVWRVSADGEERLQRQHLGLAQSEKVIVVRHADDDVATGELQRLVELSESFVKPEWCVGHVVFDVQVNIFVKRSTVRISARIERERDVVDVIAGQEKTGDTGRASVVDRFERGKRCVVTKDDHGCWYGRVDHIARDKTSECGMEVLEPDRDSAQVFRIGVADNEEMIGADATPPVACLRGDSRERKEQGDNQGDGSF